ncbi:MAG: hypothetical protein KAS32_02350 [Candidatus Peribacteraceae bacterium]|nr:hypothetical protein [Candidatus Peribacteraceae bacterium]
MSQQSAQSVFTVVITSANDETILDNDDIKDVYFIEDIFSYLMTGRIILRDTRGLAEFLPLVGNETITIEYGTTDQGSKDFYLVKTITFDIIKMGWIENTQDKHRHLMEFFFIQSPHKKLHMEHYSRSFKCETYTDYAKFIMENHCGITDFNEFEPCDQELQYFTTGLRTPAQNIEWLGSRAAGIKSGQPGYLLFANTKNEEAPYNFVTLESLLMNKMLMPPDAGPYTLNTHNEYNINKILHYKDQRVDKRSLERLISYTNLGFDIKRKRYLKNDYTYQEALDRFTCLGNFSLFDSGIDNITSASQEFTGEVEDEVIMKNMYYGDWIKRYCLQHTVSTVMEGHSDRYAGGMIEIAWPSASDDEIFDANMAGLFLVKSITHSFVPLSKPVYMQKMTLIKNGYNLSNGRLTPAGKTNTSGEPEIPSSDLYNLGIRGL